MDTCLICGSSHSEPRLLASDIQIISCKRCGFGWRQVRESQLDRSNPTFDPPPPASLGMDRLPSQTPEDGVEELEEISQFRTPPGSFLNLGEADGDLLETARIYGWNPQTSPHPEEQAVALETSPTAAFSWETSDLQATSSSIYDVIRCNGQLEHAPDPRRYLEWCRERLHHQGILVVSFSDRTEWDFPLYGEGSSLFKISLPRWLFTPKLLKRLLEERGFKVLRLSPYWIEDPLHASAYLGNLHPPWGLDAPPLNLNNNRVSPPQQIKRFRLLARLEQAQMRLTQHNWNYQTLPKTAQRSRDYSAKPAEICLS